MAVLKSWPAIALVTALALAPLRAAQGASESRSEAQVRANLVYNLMSFTEWPEPLPADQSLIVGVLGNDAVAAAIRAFGKLSNGRALEVRSISDGDLVPDCQVLYVSAVADRTVAATLARVARTAVLTIGEQDRFTQLGGIVRVFPENHRLRFDVAVHHANAVRLRISSRALNLAHSVKETDD